MPASSPPASAEWWRPPDSATLTPLRPLRIGPVANGGPRRAERNLGEYWSDDLKFSYCASDGLESEATAPCRAHDHMAVGSRMGSSGGQGARGRLASRAAVKLGGCAWVWWRDQGGGDNRLRKASLALFPAVAAYPPQGGAARAALPQRSCQRACIGSAAGGSTTAKGRSRRWFWPCLRLAMVWRPCP